MSDPIVILTEEPLGADDRVNIETLLAGGDAPLVVLVPASTERHLLVDFLENLSLLEISKAFRELTAHADPAGERAEAAETLAVSLAALAGLGSGVTGEIVEGKAVDGMVAKVTELGAGQAVVITRAARRCGHLPHRLGHQGPGQTGPSGPASVCRIGIYRGLLSVSPTMSIFSNKPKVSPVASPAGSDGGAAGQAAHHSRREVARRKV